MAIPFSPFVLSFKNEHIIYERTVKCSIKDYEMRYSYNPSLLASGSNQNLIGFSTSESFSPYVTSIGLYNDANELLAVAKFGKPIPISSKTDQTFLIKMDI